MTCAEVYKLHKAAWPEEGGLGGKQERLWFRHMGNIMGKLSLSNPAAESIAFSKIHSIRERTVPKVTSTNTAAQYTFISLGDA